MRDCGAPTASLESVPSLPAGRSPPLQRASFLLYAPARAVPTQGCAPSTRSGFAPPSRLPITPVKTAAQATECPSEETMFPLGELGGESGSPGTPPAPVSAAGRPTSRRWPTSRVPLAAACFTCGRPFAAVVTRLSRRWRLAPAVVEVRHQKCCRDTVVRRHDASSGPKSTMVKRTEGNRKQHGVEGEALYRSLPVEPLHARRHGDEHGGHHEDSWPAVIPP